MIAQTLHSWKLANSHDVCSNLNKNLCFVYSDLFTSPVSLLLRSFHLLHMSLSTFSFTIQGAVQVDAEFDIMDKTLNDSNNVEIVSNDLVSITIPCFCYGRIIIDNKYGIDQTTLIKIVQKWCNRKILLGVCDYIAKGNSIWFMDQLFQFIREKIEMSFIQSDPELSKLLPWITQQSKPLSPTSKPYVPKK